MGVFDWLFGQSQGADTSSAPETTSNNYDIDYDQLDRNDSWNPSPDLDAGAQAYRDYQQAYDTYKQAKNNQDLYSGYAVDPVSSSNLDIGKYEQDYKDAEQNWKNTVNPTYNPLVHNQTQPKTSEELNGTQYYPWESSSRENESILFPNNAKSSTELHANESMAGDSYSRATNPLIPSTNSGRQSQVGDSFSRALESQQKPNLNIFAQDYSQMQSDIAAEPSNPNKPYEKDYQYATREELLDMDQNDAWQPSFTGKTQYYPWENQENGATEINGTLFPSGELKSDETNGVLNPYLKATADTVNAVYKTLKANAYDNAAADANILAARELDYELKLNFDTLMAYAEDHEEWAKAFQDAHAQIIDTAKKAYGEDSGVAEQIEAKIEQAQKDYLAVINDKTLSDKEKQARIDAIQEEYATPVKLTTNSYDLPLAQEASALRDQVNEIAPWINKEAQANPEAQQIVSALEEIRNTTKDSKLRSAIDKAIRGGQFTDDFVGQFAASFQSGQIGEFTHQAFAQLAQAYDRVEKGEMDADDPKLQEYIDTVEAYMLLTNYFNLMNLPALDEENVVLGNISQDFARYLPQYFEQTKASLKPIAIGAGIGFGVGELMTPIPLVDGLVGLIAGGIKGAVGGTIAGTKVGGLVGTGKYSYDTMRGASLYDLINMGADVNQAVAASKDEAIISSIIENTDNAADLFTLIPNLGKFMTRSLAKSAALWFGNVVQEQGEEYTQEIVTIANERRIDENGNVRNGCGDLFNECIAVWKEISSGSELGQQYKERCLQAAHGGAVVGGIMPLLHAGAYNTVINPIRQRTLDAVNSLDANSTRQGINEQVLTGRMSPDDASSWSKIAKGKTEEEFKAGLDAFEKHNEYNNFKNITKGDVLLDGDNNPVGTVTKANGKTVTIELNGENGKKTTEIVNIVGLHGYLDSDSKINQILDDGGKIVSAEDAKDAAAYKADEAARQQAAEAKRQEILQKAEERRKAQEEAKAAAVNTPKATTDTGTGNPVTQQTPETKVVDARKTTGEEKAESQAPEAPKSEAKGLPNPKSDDLGILTDDELNSRQQQLEEYLAFQTRWHQENTEESRNAQQTLDAIKAEIDKRKTSGEERAEQQAPQSPKATTIQTNPLTQEERKTTGETRAEQQAPEAPTQPKENPAPSQPSSPIADRNDSAKTVQDFIGSTKKDGAFKEFEINGVKYKAVYDAKKQSYILMAKTTKKDGTESRNYHVMPGTNALSAEGLLNQVAKLGASQNASESSQSASPETGNSVPTQAQEQPQVQNETLNTGSEEKAAPATEEKPTNPLVEEKTEAKEEAKTEEPKAEQSKTESKANPTPEKGKEAGKAMANKAKESTPIRGTSKAYRWISNSHITPVKYDGKSYQSIGQAFKAITSNKNLTQEQKVILMKDLLRDKFSFGSVLGDKLLETGDRKIVSEYKLDGTFDPANLNEVGKLIMEVRDELRNTQQKKNAERANKSQPAPDNVKQNNTGNTVLTESQKARAEAREKAKAKKKAKKQSIITILNRYMHGTQTTVEKADLSKADTQSLFSGIKAAAKALGIERNEDEKYGDFLRRLYKTYGVEDNISSFFGTTEAKNQSDTVDIDSEEETDRTTWQIDQAYNTANQGNEVSESEMDSVHGSLEDSLSPVNDVTHVTSNIKKIQETIDEWEDKFAEQRAEDKPITKKQQAVLDSLYDRLSKEEERLEVVTRRTKYETLLERLGQIPHQGKAKLPVLTIDGGKKIVNPTLSQFFDFLNGHAAKSTTINYDSETAQEKYQAIYDLISEFTEFEDPANVRVSDILDYAAEHPDWQYDVEVAKPNTLEHLNEEQQHNFGLIQDYLEEIIARGEYGTLGLRQERGVKYERAHENNLTAEQLKALGIEGTPHEEFDGSLIGSYGEDNELIAKYLNEPLSPLTKVLQNMIDYEAVAEDDGVHVYYNWEALQQILSDPFNDMHGILKRVKDSNGNTRPSMANARALCDVLEHILPGNDEYVAYRTPEDTIAIRRANSWLNNRTVVEEEAGYEWSIAQAKKLALELLNKGKITPDGYDSTNDARKNSKVLHDILPREELYKRFMQDVKENTERYVAEAEARGETFNAEEVWKKTEQSVYVDPETGVEYQSGRGLRNLMVDDFVRQHIYQYMDALAQNREQKEVEWQEKEAKTKDKARKLRKEIATLTKTAQDLKGKTDYLSKKKRAEANKRLKAAQAELDQTKDIIDEINFMRASYDEFIDMINSYDITIGDIADTPIGNEIFGDVNAEDSLAHAFQRVTVKGMMNAETRENAEELVNWLNEKKKEDSYRGEDGKSVSGKRFTDEFGSPVQYGGTGGYGFRYAGSGGDDTLQPVESSMDGRGRTNGIPVRGQTSGTDIREERTGGSRFLGLYDPSVRTARTSSDQTQMGDSGTQERGTQKRNARSSKSAPSSWRTRGLTKYNNKVEATKGKAEISSACRNLRDMVTGIAQKLTGTQGFKEKALKDTLKKAGCEVTKAQSDGKVSYMVGQNVSTIEEAAECDARFNKAIKLIGKIPANVTVKICEAYTEYDQNFNPSRARGTMYSDGSGNYTIYAADYDGLMHEVYHVVADIAKNNLFSLVEKSGNHISFEERDNRFNKYMETMVRRAFDEANQTDLLEKILARQLTTANTQYSTTDLFEELFVELAAQKLGDRFSGWYNEDYDLNNVYDLLKDTPALAELTSTLEKGSKGVTSRQFSKSGFKYDYGDTSVNDMTDDELLRRELEYLNESADREPEFYDAQEEEEYLEALAKEYRETDKITLGDKIHEVKWKDKDGKEHVRRFTTEGLAAAARAGGIASNEKQRYQNTVDSELYNDDEAMQEARESLERNRGTARRRSQKDTFGVGTERVQEAQKRLNRSKPRSAFFNERIYYRQHGKTNASMRNFKNVSQLGGHVTALLDGKTSFRSFNDYAESNKETPVVGVVLDERMRKELGRVAALEEAAHNANSPEESAVTDYQYAAARAAAHLVARMDMVERTEKAKANFDKLAKESGKSGNRNKLQNAMDWNKRMQISGDNFWRMMGNWDKNGNNDGYSYADDHNKSIASRISEEAKLKNCFTEQFSHDKIDTKSQEFKDFISGKTMSKVKIEGHEISLMEAIKLLKIMNTLDEYDRVENKPDSSRLSSLDGFCFKDKNGQSVFIDIPGGYFSKGEDLGDSREHWLSNTKLALMNEIFNNKIANAYYKATNDMYKLASEDANKVFAKVNGYERYMYKYGQYTDIHYAKKNTHDIDFDYQNTDVTDVDDTASMKDRSRDAGGYIMVTPMSKSVDAYISQISNYIAFEEFGQRLNVLQNGLMSDGSLNRTIRETYGDQFDEWFDNYVKTMTLYKDRGKEMSGWDKGLQKARQLMMSGALVGSVSVPFKQVSSFFDTFGMLDPTSVFKAFITNPAGRRVKGINNYLYQARQNTISDPDYAELFGEKGLFSKARNVPILKNLVNLATKGTNMMDVNTVSNVYKACIYDVQSNMLPADRLFKNGKNFKDGLTSEGQFYVDSKFEQVLLGTQPIFTPQARNELARTDNQLLRMFQTFRTQQTQNYNRMLQAASEFAAADSSNKGEALKTLGQTMEGHLIAAASLSALTAIANGILHKHRRYKDDDDELDDEKFKRKFFYGMIESMAGNHLWIGDISKWTIDMINSLRDENWDWKYSNKEAQYFDVGKAHIPIPSSGAIGTALQMLNSAINLFADVDQNGWTDSNKLSARYVAGNMATAMGAPLNNIYTAMNAGYQWYNHIAYKITGDKKYEHKYDDFITQMLRVDYSQQNRLINAIMKNNDDKIDDFFENMGEDAFQKAVMYGALDNYKSGKINEEEYLNMLIDFGGKSYKDASKEVQNKIRLIESGISQFNGIDGRDGRAKFYDTYSDRFPSRESYKQFFTDVKNGKRDGKHNTYYTTYNKQQQEVSANQSSIIDRLNENIRAGNITYDTAKLLWENYYGYSSSKWSAWQYVGK